MKLSKKQQKDIDEHNWLTYADVGHPVLVTGHWSGNFQGVVEYGGNNVALVRDSDDVLREICYIKPVRFVRL